MDDLTGKVALVTGASRGIGRAIAFRLAEAGCDVAVNYRERAAEAAETCAGIRARGRRAVAIAADVSRAGDVRDLVEKAKSELGSIAVVVNNAGIAMVQKIEEIQEADWDRTVAVNMTSSFLVTQAVLPGMRLRKWGRVIFISSVAAQAGSIVGPHYAAAKAGMLGLMRGYAKLLAREGITVNAIAPALIQTEMVTSNPNASPDLIPTGRFGTVDEVADAALLLTVNGYITGQTINVNGGWYMS